MLNRLLFTKIFKMGKKVGIWVDCEKAHIISLFPERYVFETIESDVETRVRYDGESKSFSGKGGALVNPSKKKTKRRKHQLDNFIEMLVEKVFSAEEVFIFGPADTKKELSKGLRKRKDCPPVRLSSADKMTERQMVARVKEHFNQ